MTTANEEFSDLMPHRIEVQGAATSYDDYGKPVAGEAPRVYRCLIDDTTTTARTADGTSITVALTAYVAPVPIGGSGPVDIGSDESVRITNPYDRAMKVKSIERHWDAEDGKGMLHNLVVRFG